jgi:hypothetical protein
MEVRKMRYLKKLSAFTVLLSLLLSFETFAMNKTNYSPYIPDPPQPSPMNEEKYEDRSLGARWIWVSDSLCIRYKSSEYITKDRLKEWYELGMASRWVISKDGTWEVKSRDTYTGKWTQSTDGIWSFEFDDKTIPVGMTKINGVLYAFNGYGELKEGYSYYNELKTAADGLVTADGAEFTQWLTTQYLPECTSHE